MDHFIEQHKEDYENVISHLISEISSLKTGRATPLLVENIPVEAYGMKMPLKQLASISIPDARSILIEPWDKTVIKEIEKSITISNIGLNPVNDGNHLRIIIPQLTEEDRKKLIKILSQKLEQARIGMRGIRDKIKDKIGKMEKDKEISQDKRFGLQKDLDEFTSKYNDKIKEIGEKKEQEINTI